jgi:fatty-acyl-CoA synthase
MLGLVQFQPLLLSAMIEHAAHTWPDAGLIARDGQRTIRLSYAEAAARARRLASSLVRLGFGPGDVISSLAWTTHQHFELMYAIPGIGVALHTANTRLSAEHTAFTINHAGARMLFLDRECIAQVEALAPSLPGIDTYVIMADRAAAPAPRLPKVLYYEELIADGVEDFRWPSFDERTAATICFTSGTTGDPKGVVYSHRGSYLSALTIAAPNAWAVARGDTIIATTPFFHCNGWGTPYLAPIAGVDLILPGRAHDGASLQRLIVEEGATVGPGVPTIWWSIAEHCRKTGASLGKLNRIVCGGAAAPLELMRVYWREFGIRSIQAWGMTETTHAATIDRTPDEVLSGAAEPRAPQGRPIPGTEIRIVDAEGKPLPHDGRAAGHLQVKGHWCATGYLERPDIQLNDSTGWLNTGDLATIESSGGLRITDRIKDVIKSGGEWISSIDLENAALGHPSIAAAAVIGVPHPRWQERPVLFVVKRPGHTVSTGDVQRHLGSAVAKWWLPDEIVFVEALPYTATGKVSKEVLRQNYGSVF